MNDVQTFEAIQKRYKVELRKAEDVYNVIDKHGKYTSSYKNVRYTREQAVYRFNNGLALNCGDYAEHIAAPLLRVLGYKVNIWLTAVKCANGWTGGHWLLLISGRRWTNKIFDPTAAALHKPFGQPVCLVLDWIFNTGRSITD